MVPDTLDQNTWWGSQIHGGEAIHGGQPTYMVAWPAGRPALVGGQVGWGPGGRAGPAPKAGLLAGQATMYVGCPPCIWLPHHVF